MDNKDVFDLCQMNQLDEMLPEGVEKEYLRQKIERQAKVVIANTPPPKEETK